MNLTALAKDVHALAREKGWWNGVDRETCIPEKIALMHSELSEALEEYRNNKPLIYYDNLPDGSISTKPEGLGIELADCIIRILDLTEAMAIDIETCLLTKYEYNKTRPYRHGGKKI